MERAKRWNEATDKLRNQVDLTAKALGGVGTAAVTAVGIARIGDLFPVSDGWRSWLWFSLALAGFLALATGVLTITYRLWKVHQPIALSTDPRDMVKRGDIDDAKEKADVEQLFAIEARLNGVSSLSAYEARAHQLSRIAARTLDATAKQKLEAESAAIEADIISTFARTRLRLLRRRTTNAIRGIESVFAYGLLIGGILLFALGTDYVASERTEKVAIAKACGDAGKAGADINTLPSICGNLSSDTGTATEETTMSPAQEQAKAAESTIQSLKRCLALVDARKAAVGSCSTIAEAAQVLLKAGR